jgi:lysozyme family protein
MPLTTFDAALEFIWDPDRDGHQDDRAPGETFATAWGITAMTWNAAVADGIVTGELADATQEQCAAIYRARYWAPLHCDSFAPGVALVLFADATLTGVGHVARLLQRIVGTVQDGAIGPRTIAAAARWIPDALIGELIGADEAYLATLANAPKFLHGWTRREEQLRTAALVITGGPAIA